LRLLKSCHQAGVAQLVERLICNQNVGGSNPFTGSKYFQAFLIMLCFHCQKPTRRKIYKYFSNKYQADFQYEKLERGHLCPRVSDYKNF
jgi:hypothetical protein